MGACMSCIDNCVECIPLYNGSERARYTQIPIVNQPDIIDLPLKSVNVMSSHNSYINTLQHASESSTDGIHTALNCGVRCLELDVYREPTQPENVFVAHGAEGQPRDIITTTKLPFEDAIAYIAANAFRNTSDPLFLALELNVHADAKACDSILRILEKHLGGILYADRVTPDTPLRDLVGKVVLMSGGGATGALCDRIHIQWNAQFLNEASSLRVSSTRITEDCIRIYPEGDVFGALSLNYDPMPFLHAGATFVAMNVCTNDKPMKKYADYFSRSSFVRSPTI